MVSEHVVSIEKQYCSQQHQQNPRCLQLSEHIASDKSHSTGTSTTASTVDSISTAATGGYSRIEIPTCISGKPNDKHLLLGTHGVEDDDDDDDEESDSESFAAEDETESEPDETSHHEGTEGSESNLPAEETSRSSNIRRGMKTSRKYSIGHSDHSNSRTNRFVRESRDLNHTTTTTAESALEKEPGRVIPNRREMLKGKRYHSSFHLMAKPNSGINRLVSNGDDKGNEQPRASPAKNSLSHSMHAMPCSTKSSPLLDTSINQLLPVQDVLKMEKSSPRKGSRNGERSSSPKAPSRNTAGERSSSPKGASRNTGGERPLRKKEPLVEERSAARKKDAGSEECSSSSLRKKESLLSEEWPLRKKESLVTGDERPLRKKESAEERPLRKKESSETVEDLSLSSDQTKRKSRKSSFTENSTGEEGKKSSSKSSCTENSTGEEGKKSSSKSSSCTENSAGEEGKKSNSKSVEKKETDPRSRQQQQHHDNKRRAATREPSAPVHPDGSAPEAAASEDGGENCVLDKRAERKETSTDSRPKSNDKRRATPREQSALVDHVSDHAASDDGGEDCGLERRVERKESDPKSKQPHDKRRTASRDPSAAPVDPAADQAASDDGEDCCLAKKRPEKKDADSKSKQQHEKKRPTPKEQSASVDPARSDEIDEVVLESPALERKASSSKGGDKRDTNSSKSKQHDKRRPARERATSVTVQDEPASGDGDDCGFVVKSVASCDPQNIPQGFKKFQRPSSQVKKETKESQVVDVPSSDEADDEEDTNQALLSRLTEHGKQLVLQRGGSIRNFAARTDKPDAEDMTEDESPRKVKPNLSLTALPRRGSMRNMMSDDSATEDSGSKASSQSGPKMSLVALPRRVSTQNLAASADSASEDVPEEAAAKVPNPRREGGRLSLVALPRRGSMRNLGASSADEGNQLVVASEVAVWMKLITGGIITEEQLERIRGEGFVLATTVGCNKSSQ